ncbi:hypothetical protein FRC06_007805, partial [Ceratobasidium sp. 370]
MSLISDSCRRDIERWIELVSNSVAARLSDHVHSSMTSDDEVVAIEPRGRPIIKARPTKRQRDDSSPLEEQHQVIIERNTTATKHRRPTPYESSTRAPTPVISERAPSEAGLSESGHASEASSAPTVPRRVKTKLKRQDNPPEQELQQMIKRIKTSKSDAYNGFSDPVIDWSTGNPPTRHIWTCLSCKKQVTRAVGASDTSAFRTHKDRYCKKLGDRDTALGDHGFRGSGENMTERDVRELCALWVARCSRPMSILNDPHLDRLLHPSVRRYKPHRTTISADIKLMYRAMQQKITGDLAGVRGAMHIALDLYAADNGYDYLGIVIFHQEIVGATMKIKRHVLDFDGDAHTGKNLAKKMLEVLTKFGIQHRFWGLVGDGASNNDTMLERLAKYKLERHKGRKSRVYCLCHVLNLGAQQAAKPFRKSIAVDSDEEDYDEVDEDADAEEEGDVSASAQNAEVDEHDEDGEALSWALDDEDEDLESDIGREVDDYDIPSIIPNSEDDIVAKRAGLILKKLAYFAKKIRFSPYAKKVFVVACVELKLERTHNIRRDVRTRWNSTGDMTED